MMKNIKPYLLSAILLLTMTASFAGNGDKLTKENIQNKSKAEIKLRVETLQNRIKQIRGTDISSLDQMEKDDLKNEVKGIQKELKTADGYITISIGAVIIILLLLILLT